MKLIIRKLVSLKIFARFCQVDITRVLLWELPEGLSADRPTNTAHEHTCRLLRDNDLRDLVHDTDFQVSQQFINDYHRLGFTGVALIVDSHIAGVLFLVAHVAAARHNSGGSAFKGIALDLPDGAFYLFKVFVKPQFRGNGKMAAMLNFAAGHLQSANAQSGFEGEACEGIQCIVTTTHWQNTAFLNSAERIGFIRCGFATEIVLALRHFYLLPKPFRLNGNVKRPGDDERLSIRFLRPSPDYS